MARVTDKMSLRVWDLLGDVYDHDQLADNWAKVDYHDHTFGRGTQIPTDGLEDGAVTAAKLAPGAFGSIASDTITADMLKVAVADTVGVSTTGVTRTGKSIIDAVGTTQATSYGSLSNGPDVVTGVNLKTNGLIFVVAQGIWSHNAAAGVTGNAAIFLTNTQLKQLGNTNVYPQVQEALLPAGSSGIETPYYSVGYGLNGVTQGATSVGAVPTTGTSIGSSVSTATGGTCMIYAAQGTYDVSIKFKISNAANTLSVRDRKLWVWTKAFV